jgi:hypothetical protein
MSVDLRPALTKVLLRAAPLHHPVVLAHQRARSASFQARLADTITAFAGSMPFVYLHAVGFAIWMFLVESQPWPKLTLVVSLEAIFLSAFVMIGQNRQAAFQQAKADHDFVEQEQELKKNLREGSRQVVLWSGVELTDYPKLTVTLQSEGAGPASSGRVVLTGDIPDQAR